MKAAGIILAAGESKRMGRPKASLPFRDGTFLSVLARTFGEFFDPVIAVFGAQAGAAAAGVLPVMNPDYKLGMLTSLQAGLRALARSEARIGFTLVDHPAVSRETVATLLDARDDIVVPRMNGRRGHPVIISAEIAAEFLREPFTSKVRDVIDRHAGSIRYVDVNDPGISDDVDDLAAYQALLAREAPAR